MYDIEFIDKYLTQKPGATKDYKAEWGWDRYMVGGKMFAAICTPGASHPDYAHRTLLTLKCDPDIAIELRHRHPDAIIPGFYCNKQHWNSVYVDAEIPDETMLFMMNMAYELVFAKLTKRVREGISGGL